jgi:hypothetical protein
LSALLSGSLFSPLPPLPPSPPPSQGLDFYNDNWFGYKKKKAAFVVKRVRTLPRGQIFNKNILLEKENIQYLLGLLGQKLFKISIFFYWRK